MPIKVPPSPGPSTRSANMRANRRRDTGPELLLRRALHGMGLRYRVDQPIRAGEGRPVRPDIAFTRLRVAVFVDGCFWHGCPVHGQRQGGSNESYWSPKIARNRERDEEHVARLAADGWVTLRFWEHEPLEHMISAVLETLHAREADPPPRVRRHAAYHY